MRGFRLLENIDVKAVATDHDAMPALTLETGLTACDASHSWLSRRSMVELATLDRWPMAEVARSS